MKIFCIGRNYAQHAKELGNTVPKQPMVFMKPATAKTTDATPFYIPDWTNNLHYEVELVIRIAKNGKAIHPDFYMDYIDSVCLGIDFTARDIQSKLKEKGHPWEIAKAFDKSALVSDFVPFDEFVEQGGNFALLKNDEIVQQGHYKEMIFDIKTLLVHVSTYFTLQTGDLLFTGTPAGVGPVVAGDKLVGKLNDQKRFELNIK